MKPELLVVIKEIEEHRHENPRVWKLQEYIELQKIMSDIRKKEVSIIFNTPNK